MQTADGTFKMLTEVEADEWKGKGKGGRILRVGGKAAVLNKNEGRAMYVIESIGEQFIRVRALAGHTWTCKVGDEVTIDECAFIIISKTKQVLLLEGVPPSPTLEDR